MMLALKNIHHALNKTVLLQFESLTVHSGEILGLLGPNGAGKSTLLKIITGEKNCHGEKIFHDKALTAWEQRELARHLACLPQHSELNFPFTVWEVVELGLIPLSLRRRSANKAIDYYLKITDCLSLKNRLYPSLSGGERQRVHLARVLLQLSQAEKSPFLLLDEPMSAQDLKYQHLILHLLKEYSSNGFGIIIILHDINQAARYCDNICLLKSGKILYQGATTDVLNEQTIHEIWEYQASSYRISDRSVVFV